MDFYQKIFKGQFDLAQRDIQEKLTSEFDAQLFFHFLNAIHGKFTNLKVSTDYEELNETRSLLIAWITALSEKNYQELIDLAETHRDNPVAQWLGGSACSRIKNCKKAKDFYQRSINLEPTNPLFAWTFGTYYLANSPVQFRQAAKWYKQALENGYPVDLLWIIRYLEIFNFLQGSLIRGLIFICIWVCLATFPPTRLVWGGFYVIVMFLHLKVIDATFRLKDMNLVRWLILRAIFLSLAPIVFVYLWG